MPSVLNTSVLNARAPEKEEISRRKKNLERLQVDLTNRKLFPATGLAGRDTQVRRGDQATWDTDNQ